MQSPSREGIAERTPHDNRDDACDGQHHDAEREIAGRLQRCADDRDGKRCHPDERQTLGRVDGFDQDEAADECEE